jgi:opacity protein-like surface antigen
LDGLIWLSWDWSASVHHWEGGDRLNRKGYLVGVLAVALMAWASAAQAAETHTGFGVFGNIEMPVLSLSKWYSQAPKFGATILHAPNENYTMEIEYHYAPYRNGKIEKKTFVWSVDQRSYGSPNAKAEMNVQSLLFNFLFRLGNKGRQFSGKGASPYIMVGAGFVGYKNKVSGLAYPFQTKAPFNTNAWPASETRNGQAGGLLEPDEERRVTIGTNFGLGVEKFVSAGMSIDLRVRYNFAIGRLKPRELWAIKETWPLQAADLGVALKFYK